MGQMLPRGVLKDLIESSAVQRKTAMMTCWIKKVGFLPMVYSLIMKAGFCYHQPGAGQIGERSKVCLNPQVERTYSS